MPRLDIGIDGYIKQGWTPDAEDLLAQDWYIVEEH